MFVERSDSLAKYDERLVLCIDNPILSDSPLNDQENRAKLYQTGLYPSRSPRALFSSVLQEIVSQNKQLSCFLTKIRKLTDMLR